MRRCLQWAQVVISLNPQYLIGTPCPDLPAPMREGGYLGLEVVLFWLFWLFCLIGGRLEGFPGAIHAHHNLPLIGPAA